MRRRIDFEYEQDAKHGFVLSGWKAEYFDRNAKLAKSCTAQVTQWEINRSLRRMSFALSFQKVRMPRQSLKSLEK